MNEISETAVNVISERTVVRGDVSFGHVTRFHGTIRGNVEAVPGSLLVLGEPSVVEGNVRADTLIVDGFVRGDVQARTRVVVTGTGRVLGNISAPVVKIEFGAFFQGSCRMEELIPGAAPRLKPA